MRFINPFETLGITPEVLRNIPRRNREEFLKTHYRNLQKIFHPDKGGDEVQAGKIAEAYEIVTGEDPQFIEQLLEDYLTPDQETDKLRRTENELVRISNDYEQIAGRFHDYVISLGDLETESAVLANDLELIIFDNERWKDITKNMKIVENMDVETHNKSIADNTYVLRKEKKGISKTAGGVDENYPTRGLIGTINSPEALQGFLDLELLAYAKQKTTGLLSGGTNIYNKNKFPGFAVHTEVIGDLIPMFEHALQPQGYVFSYDQKHKAIYCEGQVKAITRANT